MTETVLNRTKLYLSPVLNVFPETFIKEFNKVVNYLDGYFIYDLDYYKAKRWQKPVPVIFLKYRKSGIKGFLKYVRSFSGYIDDYALDFDDQICIVLKIPTRYHQSFYDFLNGMYSLMYSKEDLKKVGIKPLHRGKANTVWLVCTKNILAIEYYKQVIKLAYSSDHYNPEPDEYDIPPRINHEVLNWKKDIKYIKDYLILTNK